MAFNLELKARCTDQASAAEIAGRLTGAEPEEITQTDIYYEVAYGRLKVRMFGDDAAELIWYERPENSTHRISRYEKRAVQDIDNLLNIFDTHLQRIVTVRKSRSLYILNDCRIHIDSVEGLGEFIEFEVILLDPADTGENRMAELRAAFDIKEDDIIRGSYADLVGKSEARNLKHEI
jgi:predicted adenylyl cyclase CyaB